MRANRGWTGEHESAGSRTGAAPGKRALTDSLIQRKPAAAPPPPPQLAAEPRPDADATDDPFGLHLLGEDAEEEEDGAEGAEELDEPVATAAAVQLKRKKRRKKKQDKAVGVIVRPDPINLQLDKPTRVLFDTNARPPKGATWGFIISDTDAVSVTQPVKPAKDEPAEAAVTVTGHKTGEYMVGATLLTKDGQVFIKEAPVKVTTKRLGSAYTAVAKAWGKNAGEGLLEQLIVWGSMWDPDVIETYRLDISIATGEHDEFTWREAIHMLRTNVGESLIAKVRENPTGTLESLSAFRADPRHARMMGLGDFPEHDEKLSDAVQSGIRQQIMDRVKPILKKAKNVRGALLQPLANELTAEALAPYRQVDARLAEDVRNGFYTAVKDLFEASGERAVAICFIHAMTDVMVGHFDNEELRDEVPIVANELATMANDDKRIGVKGALAVNLASDTATLEKTNLMDDDLQRNSVEVQYTKLYLGIRQAVQTVGAHWIKARTQGLRDDIATTEAWQTWVGRGMNVGWAACPTWAVAAPVELAGILVDTLLSVAIASAEEDLARREAAMQAELDRRLGAMLRSITDQAAADFQAIADDGAVVTTIAKNVFQSINDIEALYSEALIAELDALPRDR